MEIVTTTVLALGIGLTLGYTIKKKLLFQKIPLMGNFETSKNMEMVPEYQKISVTPYFDTLEGRFLQKLIDSDKGQISMAEINTLLRIEKLSKENQRQRRHLFLKDLNVKLKMIFGISECIERHSADEDRRTKYYRMNKNVDVDYILKHIEK